jgi:ATP-dependent helicase/nuclease subunit A
MLETVRDLFFTGSGSPRARLATKAVDPAVCEWLAEEQQRLDAAFEEARAQKVAEDTVNALGLAWLYAQAYEAEKQARGALDFADLIVRTRALLAERPDAAWVLYKLDGGVDHLLVDEAQDTAPDQWEIVRQLTADFFSGEGATEAAVARTVFAVGDEKQSIFSFQGAAPEYLERETRWYEEAVQTGGGTFHALRMIDSWRSAPGVLSYVDDVFAPKELLSGLRAREDLAEDDLLRHIAKRAEAGGTVDLWPLEREQDSEDRQAWDAPLDLAVAGNAYARLADKIAAEIEAMVARGEAVHGKDGLRPIGYGDVLILVRKRKRLFEELIRALRRRGVPVAGADRLALSEHIAFDDLLALGRFVLFPDDDLTLAALLRSPFCDLDEQELFALAQPRKGSLWRALQQSEHEAAKDFLAWALKTGRERPPFDFYGRVLSRLDGEGRSMRSRFATRLGSEALDAADEFLAEALSAERRGVHELESLIDALSRLKLVVKREMDEPKGEVRVMTAHGAKGLEAPVVFLPETVGAGAGRGSPLLELEGGGFLWCGSKSGDCAASRAARERREKKAEDEALRLLYVALTRARDRLVVAGRVNARDKEESVKGWWKPLCAAFERLPGVRAAASASGLEIRRYGADPALVPPAVPLRAAGAAVPAWALRPAPPEPAVARYAAPSTLAEAGKGPAPSPLARANGLGRFRRGLVIHRLLEVLPDLPPADWDAAAARLLAKEPDLSQDQRAEIAGAALAVLRDPRFAEVFGPGSRAEAAVAGAARDLPDGLSISGRVDRMLVTPDRILVADFKSNRPAPSRVEDADPAYLVQMAVYVAVLREAFPGRAVEAALVWTDGPGLMPIPEHVITARLAELKRGG